MSGASVSAEPPVTGAPQTAGKRDWGNSLVALLFLGFDDATVTVNLSQLMGRLGEGWQLLTAAAFVTMIIPMIVFFTLQRFFIRGMTSGAVKG